MSLEVQLTVKRPTEARPRNLMDVESLFDRMFGNLWLYTEKDDVIVKAEMPGLTKDEIDVSVSGKALTIKGEKKKEEETKDKDYYQCERSYGAYSRSIELPVEVKTDSMKASFKDGVLEVRLPKTEKAKNGVVRVKVL